MTLAMPLLLAGLMAGFGRVDLEPPAGHSLAGYFGPRPCEGVLDPVEASCVALSDGSFGYLPTDDAYDAGAYETDSSIFAPESSRRLIQALQEMMTQEMTTNEKGG